MAPDEFRNKKKGTIPADGYLGAGARSSMSALSIRKRLPLLIGMLLLVIVGASTWAAYRGVRDSATEVGRERLRNLTQQFAALSQQSTDASLNRTSVVANDAAVRTFLQSPSSATREAANRVLQQFAPGQDPNSIQVELWRADRSLALVVPENLSPVPASLAAEFDSCGREPFKTPGALRPVDNNMAGLQLNADADSEKPLVTEHV